MKVKTLACISAALIIGPVLALAALSLFGKSAQQEEFQGPLNMLILAAHQDDGVIQAGGAAIKNAKLGGRTQVVYMISPESAELRAVLMREAEAAWALVGRRREDLTFLGYPPGANLWPDSLASNVARDIREIVAARNPDRVYIPLTERGNVDHDVLNSIARDVLRDFPDVQVVQSSEYNPYYLAGRHPNKMLRFFLRLLPKLPFSEPTSGLGPNSLVSRLSMSASELEIKKQMLKQFKSQAGVIRLSQFGYADVYDKSHELPDGVLVIGGKYFSVTAMVLLISFLTGFVLLGVLFALVALPLVFVLAIASAGVITTINLLTNYRRIFMEDYLVLALVVFGMLPGIVLRAIRYRMKAKRKQVA